MENQTDIASQISFSTYKLQIDTVVQDTKSLRIKEGTRTHYIYNKILIWKARYIVAANQLYSDLNQSNIKATQYQTVLFTTKWQHFQAYNTKSSINRKYKHRDNNHAQMLTSSLRK
jgi:hypothetical protein